MIIQLSADEINKIIHCLGEYYLLMTDKEKRGEVSMKEIDEIAALIGTLRAMVASHESI